MNWENATSLILWDFKCWCNPFNTNNRQIAPEKIANHHTQNELLKPAQTNKTNKTYKRPLSKPDNKLLYIKQSTNKIQTIQKFGHKVEIKYSTPFIQYHVIQMKS